MAHHEVRIPVDVPDRKEDAEPLADEVSKCQRFKVSKVSQTICSDEQERVEGALSGERQIDAKRLAEMDALLEREVHAWVLCVAQENG